MLSSTVTAYVKSTRELSALLLAHADDVSAKITASLAPHCKKGESVPNVALLLRLFARRVEALATTLEAADTTHEAELRDDDDPRRRRDTALEDLRTALIEIKRTITALYGADLAKKLGFPDEVPNDTTMVPRVAKDAADNLAGAKLPKPKIEGVASVSAAPWIAKLRGPLKDLDTANKDVAREAREAKVTMVARNQALAAFEAGYSGAAGVGWALLAAAGENEHAASVSLSPRRATGARTAGRDALPTDGQIDEEPLGDETIDGEAGEADAGDDAAAGDEAAEDGQSAAPEKKKAAPKTGAAKTGAAKADAKKSAAKKAPPQKSKAKNR